MIFRRKPSAAQVIRAHWDTVIPGTDLTAIQRWTDILAADETACSDDEALCSDLPSAYAVGFELGCYGDRKDPAKGWTADPPDTEGWTQARHAAYEEGLLHGTAIRTGTAS